MSRTRPSISLWLTHPVNGLTLLVIGWVAWPFIGASTDGIQNHPGLFFPLGMLVVPVLAFLWAWPTRLILTDEALVVSRPLRPDETLPLSDITTVSAGYMPKAGPRAESPDRRATLSRSSRARLRRTSCFAGSAAASSNWT